MSLFSPRTYSTDWELLVIDKLERCVGSDKLIGFAGVLTAELGLPVHDDWNALEIALGVNTSFEQFWSRLRAVTDRAVQLVREYDLELFPAGAHPIEPMYNGSHIHVGTVHDEAAVINLQNRMMRYAPVFAAIAANSPVAHGNAGEFKSYRVRDTAWDAACPGEWRDPHLAQPDWGRDTQSKIYGSPTMEVRIMDCASSRRLLAEIATFTAAYVHHCGEESGQVEPSPEVYKEYLTNRWSAAKWGLQATFHWNGKPRPVVEIIEEMLQECAAELAVLGADRSQLGVLNAMLDKRICQADMVLDLSRRYPDPWLLASAHSKVVRNWEAFEEYLESADPLEPVDAPDEEAIIAEHLRFIGEGTHFYWLRAAMWYPAPVTDEILERLVKEQRIRREVSERSGILLHRIG